MGEMEKKALLFAEKHGIVEYTVIANKMVFFETWGTEGTYQCTVDLVTLKEKRVLIDNKLNNRRNK